MRATLASQPAPTVWDRKIAGLLMAAGGTALTLGFVWTMLVGSYDQFAAIVIAFLLTLLTLPLARHVGRIEGSSAMASLVMGAMVLRLLGAVARYLIANGVYGGVADASTYTTVALGSYKSFRHLHHIWWPNTGVYHGLVPWLDTIIYAIAGPSELGSFFVFSWFSFLGTYLFYRAFRTAYPKGDGLRYALLVFLLPSMLYWPSSLGKESWMVFAIGLSSYGLARSLVGRLGGYLSLAAGIGAMLLVRPHLALIFLPAAAIAFLLRRGVPGRRRPVGRLLGVAVLVVSSLVVVAKAQSYFGISNLDLQTITKELSTTRAQTDLGNSAFHPPNAQSPLGYPLAAITVLYRPFPFEAHNLTVGVASLEGLVMIALTAASWRRLKRLPAALWREPYVLYSLVYSALFVLAFSNFSNFGILARERVQLFPLVMALLCVRAAESSRPKPSASQARPARALPRYRAPSRPRFFAAPVTPVTTVTTLASRSFKASRTAPEGPYRAFGHRFDIAFAGEAHVEEVCRAARWALADLLAPDPPEHRYLVTVVDFAQKRGPIATLSFDGRLLSGPAPAGEVLVRLVTDVNARAIASRPDRLVLHAAALSRDGHALLLPGPSGRGKSTLAAVLVSRGLDYLSDEAAAVDAETLEVEPYPKPISLSVPALEAVGYRSRLSEFVGGASEQLVPCSALRPNSAGKGAIPAMVVFPNFEPGAVTTLEPMSRAEALMELANCSFNFVDHGGEWMGLLSRLVTTCWCGRLTVGDAGAASSVVEVDLVGRGI